MRQVMSAEELSRATTRIAHEIIERNHGATDMIVLGIPTRGEPFAGRIAAELSKIEQSNVASGSLDIGMYRDDLDTRRTGETDHQHIPFGIDGTTVVIADDVLFTGRTIRAALDALADLGRPGSVQLAVVIDRGHRQLPIRPDFVGKNIPTAHTERVFVRFEETDNEDGVWIDDGGGP
ncbi:MAG: bifunctional pyr operon transcriptional regulator/uracil phosphoribosyltransferase PyrR [Actinomycetia bacterium]|nr:bifunctional pyr operon transcriptional regulator/uracil phosphoribosyltransferase PyrR [Actinomycetes bacterium]